MKNSSKPYKIFRLLLLLGAGGCLLSGARPGAAREENPIVIGIDHIPIVVRNLDSAANTYKALGFSLKPGRPHANGIRNQHVKFRDGTELELITAPAPRDTLTAEYCQLLKEGEGPVFFGLFAPDIKGLAKQLDAGNKRYELAGKSITFSPSDPFHLLFFGNRNQSPTDKPEHFAHANSAESVTGVWLAPGNSASFSGFFQNLGMTLQKRKISFPFSAPDAQAAELKEGEVIFLPPSFQLIPGRQIIGATVKVRSIEAVKAALKQSGMKVSQVVKNGGTVSFFLSPDLTHGIWLEFRQF